MTPRDSRDLGSHDELVAEMAGTAIAAARRSRRDSRRRLLWQVPVLCAVGVGMGLAAAQVSWGGTALDVAGFGTGVFLFAFLGAWIGMGGAAPDWEANDLPFPRKRVVIGAVAGSGLSLALLCASLWIDRW